jgi:3-deoxy-D-manno-octulosonate 8-phosphate phosphatase (KDO 8-P phosphatase)
VTPPPAAAAARGTPADRLRAVRLLILDVDGVMTDGRIIVDDDGRESKFFHVHDGSAVWLLRRVGIETAIISGRTAACVGHRARDLKIEEVHQGEVEKLGALDRVCARYKITPAEVAYMGDDILDVPVLERVGFPAAPANARPEAKAAALLVTRAAGGHGAVRELAEHILRGQGLYERLLRERYGIAAAPQPAADAPP